MAILYAEPFDGYANLAGLTTALQSISNDAAFSTTGGRWGGGCMRATALDTDGIRLPLKASPGSNLVRVAFHIKCNPVQFYDATGANWIFMLTNAAADRFLRLALTSSGTEGLGATGRYSSLIYASYFDDINTTAVLIAGLGTIPVVDGQWHHVEMEFVAHATTGVCKIWIDGILNVNRVNVDTTDAASGDVTTFDRFDICGGMTNTGAADISIDDLLIWDDTGSDFTGHLSSPHRLRPILVNAAGDSAQFTPNTGANNAAVDEATNDDDTTYVESVTLGHIDLYNIGTAGNTIQTIRGVMVETIAKDTGATRTHRGLMKSGSTVANGTTSPALATAYRKYQSFFWTDPNGAIPWTQTNIEASQIGQEVTN